MNNRELLVTDLVGRTVRDMDGRSVGRLEELRAEIELHERGNEYVVREFYVGTYGVLEAVTGARFARHLVQRFGRLVGYERYAIPWEWMDLSDPKRPGVARRKEELSRV
jgi:sporulation protein YlmC with PRC-barrel domain